MNRRIELKEKWEILQDVHDAGEKLELYKKKEGFQETKNQMSEWEALPDLKHLQLIYAETPYFGRELRYFNEAPWWYKNEFTVSEEKGKRAILTFTNVDYYAKVWLNGEYIGEHEGYSAPFSFEVADKLHYGGENLLVVKVSSPWDKKVEGDKERDRTILVQRNMVKGTYEHSDTFIQRDVNPVGIYGKVELELFSEEYFAEEPQMTYELDVEKRRAKVKIKAKLGNLETQGSYVLEVFIRDKESRKICGTAKTEFLAEREYTEIQQSILTEEISLWNTWDHGGPWLYEMETVLKREGRQLERKRKTLAFRKVELERTKEKTCFFINKKPFFIRGTSYFPDNYISAMYKERYWRDLLNIKAAGFNLIRVHVHTEQKIFYQLCDELGIAVIQDSEYNWTHPSTDEWAERFIKIYKENIEMLREHPSIICWIGMNEPGCVDPDGRTRKRFMEENPGPKMYAEIRAMDPGRPVIKGSFCEEDEYSGDSHNYLGSLSGGRYGDIYGTTEKLNTEYGFDAPGCIESLKKTPRVYSRLNSIKSQIPEIQEYQYKLLKYYTEHYRIQKYTPCSGYIQFMFIDLCPQSFYGIYDWYGMPKKGLQAILESNMPVGVFLKYKEKLDGIYVVNDLETALIDCRLEWSVLNADTEEIVEAGEKGVHVNADGVLEVMTLNLKNPGQEKWDVSLKLFDSTGACIARNTYRDIFNLSPGVPGHPDRVSQELGMRLYGA